MVRFLLKRFGASLLMLVAVSVFTSWMIRQIPGDPAKAIAGEKANREAVERVRTEYGFDRPFVVQYAKFAGRLVRGDLGRSYQTGDTVAREIAVYLPATIELTLGAMLFGTTVGVLLGVALAYRRNTWLDSVGTSASLVGISMPIFWLGLVLMYVLSYKLHLFPTGGRMDVRLDPVHVTNFYLLDGLITGDATAFWDAFRHLILPAVTVGTIPLSIVTLMTRAAVIEELDKDYVKTARAKGLRERAVIYRHALKNAAVPILTISGLETAYLLGGAILTESVFGFQGIGLWLLAAVEARDYAVIQVGVLLVATIFIVVNLLTDVAYMLVDPRIRTERA